MWFTQEPKARQKVAELRVQQTQNILGCLGWVQEGLSPILFPLKSENDVTIS